MLQHHAAYLFVKKAQKLHPDVHLRLPQTCFVTVWSLPPLTPYYIIATKNLSPALYLVIWQRTENSGSSFTLLCHIPQTILSPLCLYPSIN